MSKKDIEQARKAMERFDPVVVSAAIRGMDLHRRDIERAKEGIAKAYESVGAESPAKKMEILSRAMTETSAEMLKKEVDAVKDALKGIDPGAILEVAEEVIGYEPSEYGFPICICPEDCESGRYIRVACPPMIRPICPPFIGPGCNGHEIYIAPGIDTIELAKLGEIQVKAAQEIMKDDRVSVAISDGRQFGMLGLCWEDVRCAGRQIWVMSSCLATLVSLDIGAKIRPMDAIKKIAEMDATLKKRVDKMFSAMKKGQAL